MKAAVIENVKQPLRIKEVPEPHLRTCFDVIVRVEACGVCHTDLHAADGDWPIKPVRPLIPGHEVVGIVERMGEMVTNLRIGDRVGIPWLHSACGCCSFCLEGMETLCEQQQNTGYTVNGGYAEFAVADSRYVGKIPSRLSPAAAAPHLCAGLTSYKAVKLSGSGPHKTVLVLGVGGLGHMAIQYAKVTGAKTIAVDINDERLALAKRLGADEVINTRYEDLADTMKRCGGADIVIATAVSAEAIHSSFQTLRRGGRMVLVGLPPQSLQIPTFDLVLKGISVAGSIVGTRKDLEETMGLAERGLVTCEYQTVPLDDINDVFQAMRAGTITGRMVLQIGQEQYNAIGARAAAYAIA